MAQQVENSPVDTDPRAATLASAHGRASSIAPGWDALLAEFRALGGIADNVRLGEGSRGRGLFPIDRAKPVRVRTPSNLLVPADSTEVLDGKLVVKAHAPVGDRERAFFDHYQRELSWGAFVFGELWTHQLGWNRLPHAVHQLLKNFGGIGRRRFEEPSEALCHRLYLMTRQYTKRGIFVLLPVVELANHSAAAGELVDDDGITIGGVFGDEVLVRYNVDDCWTYATRYGFFDPAPRAFSLPMKFQYEDVTVEITRMVNEWKSLNGFPLPSMRVEGSTIHFPWLMLGASNAPLLPRAAFLYLVKDTPIRRPDELFDLIQHLNRMQFLKFLQALEGHTAPLVDMLRRAAFHQLETLSSYWGTRSLETAPISVSVIPADGPKAGLGRRNLAAAEAPHRDGPEREQEAHARLRDQFLRTGLGGN